MVKTNECVQDRVPGMERGSLREGRPHTRPAGSCVVSAVYREKQQVDMCVWEVCIAEPWPVERGVRCIGLYPGLPRTWPCDSGTLRPLHSQAPGPRGGCAEAWCFFLRKSLSGSLHRQANHNPVDMLASSHPKIPSSLETRSHTERI